MQAVTVTRLTGAGAAALATIRVEGSGAVELVDAKFRGYGARSLPDLAIGAIAVGRWESSTGEEVVVGRVAADAIEIHCHGGAMASRAVLQSLCDRGAVAIDWQDWAIAREPDRISAEALEALSRSTTERCALILLDQYQGALRRAIESMLALLECGDVGRAQCEVDRLLATANLGKHLAMPFRVALVGPANVGKSSLLNRLLGFERAIVFEQPGTTRDVLDAQTTIGGWPFHFSDTAGMRSASDPIEQAGIEQALQVAAGADLALVCIAKGDHSTAIEILPGRESNALLVGTKADLAGRWPRPVEIETSARTGWGIDELLLRIERALVSHVPAAGAAVVFTTRQVARLDEARRLLARGDLTEASRALAGLIHDCSG